MAEGSFIFLGYREYDLLEEHGEDILRSVPGSGLGILRQSGRRARVPQLRQASPRDPPPGP